MTRRVARLDKFGLINLPANANPSHAGIRRANLTYMLLGSYKTAANLTQNSPAQIPSNLTADILVISQNLL